MPVALSLQRGFVVPASFLFVALFIVAVVIFTTGDAAISAYLGSSCHDVLSLLPDTWVMSAFGCTKYYGVGFFTINNSLVSLPERPGVGEIVACLEPSDRVNAWEHVGAVCTDPCSCGNTGMAYGCLNTAGCCQDARHRPVSNLRAAHSDANDCASPPTY